MLSRIHRGTARSTLFMTSKHTENLSLEANGLHFHALAAGPRDGPLVLLLHGFPEFSYGWRHQMQALAEAGLRVVAPDQRGYGQSDKPEAREAYRLDLLADDVLGLARALGQAHFSVVGHDWGGAVAWHLASRGTVGLDRMAILNAPHPGTVGPHALGSPSQVLKSWYIAFFQLPALPEWLLGADDCAWLRNTLVSTSRAGAFSDEDFEAYRKAWQQPGALAGMVNWYRALLLEPPLPAGRIRVPVRVLWGDRDGFLDTALAERGADLCEQATVTHFAEATHWLHHEEPEAVNAALLEFLLEGGHAGR